MMIKSHARERLPSEIFEDYKKRREWSKGVLAAAIAPQMSTGWPGHKAGTRRKPRDMGQHPKFKPERRRTPAFGSGPTWPRTKDQRKQSRPVIVVHPIRQLLIMLPKDWTEDRAEAIHSVNAPKWALDARVIEMRAAWTGLRKALRSQR